MCYCQKMPRIYEHALSAPRESRLCASASAVYLALVGPCFVPHSHKDPFFSMMVSKPCGPHRISLRKLRNETQTIGDMSTPATG